MKSVFAFLAFALVMAVTSCSTSIAVQVKKPAELDLHGAYSIAVLPFGYPSQVSAVGLDPFEAAILRLWYRGGLEKAEERDLAKSIETTVVKELLDAKYFKVIGSSELLSKAGNDKAAARGLVASDAVITGTISRMSSEIEDRSYMDKNGKVVPYYENKATLAIDYQVILGDTGEVIASKRFEDSAYATDSDYYKARNTSAKLYEGMVCTFAARIARDVAPYTVTEYRYLAPDETKDPRMEQAEKLVKDKFYQNAYESYASIYKENEIFAAGYNAAIVKEILGDINGALSDMEALAESSLNPKALEQAERMRRTIKELEESRKQSDSRRIG